MRFLIRGFFKSLRVLLGPFMLLWEWLTTPKGVVRPVAQQQVVDQRCRQLVLYQYRTCPFCIKVRREINRLSLPIERRDAQNDLQHRAALEAGGGRAKVPCLKITGADGQSRWLYESGQIITYLQAEFDAAA
jgi:glutaredoxin